MDQSELTSKYEEIRNWLESFDDDETIPQFEVNDETITHLHRLYKQNKEMNHLSKLLIDDLKIKNEEYKMEASRLRELMEGVGIPIYALSNAGKSSLKMLSQLASNLEIKDVKKSTFLLALQDLSIELASVMEEVASKQADNNKLVSQFKSIIKNLDDVSGFYEKFYKQSAIDLPFTEKRKKEIGKMETKSSSYTKQLNEDKQLSTSYSEKEYHHSALIQLSTELKSLKDELKPLQVKYEHFQCLPPDITRAKIEIEELKRYKDKLEKELEEDIDYLRL